MTKRQMEYHNNRFNNVGFLSVKLDQHLMDPIQKEINNLLKTNFLDKDMYKVKLAGNVEREYGVPELTDYMNKLIIPFADIFREENNIYVEHQWLSSKGRMNLRCSEPWINFQKKGEFNPTHTHSGVLSYVIWIKIPYNIQDELNLPFVKGSNTPSAGTFRFYYTNTLGSQQWETLYCDKSMNNTLLVFPSDMPHEVFPFYTSDEYRITLSGNLEFDDKEVTDLYKDIK
jgi:hypothetical protein